MNNDVGIKAAIAHLNCALIQSCPSDDQIIIRHIRDAVIALEGRKHWHRAGTGAHIDECDICGADLRCEVHAP